MHDQSYIPTLLAIGCFIMSIMAMSIILFVLRHKNKMHENEKYVQQIQNEKQIALFKASIEAEERQKKIIAANLHDSISSMLTTLKLSLTSHQSEFENNTFSKSSLDKDKKIIDQLSKEIRATCHDLIPSVLNELGLIHALEEFINTIHRSGSVIAVFNCDDFHNDLSSVPKPDQVNIYRVCQELVNNIIKHANCKRLSLISFSEPGKLCMEFKYDGKGITNEDLDLLSKKGLGLNSLKSRALILNAKLDYLKHNSGFEIKFHIPLAA